MSATRFLHITQQQAIRTLFGILISAGLLFGIIGLIQGDWMVVGIAVSGLVIDLVLLIAYQRGWRYAPVTLALLMTAFANLALQTSSGSEAGLYWALLPVVIALVLTDALWTTVAATLTLAVQLLGPASGPVYRQPEVLVGYLVVTVGLLISRLILESALTNAAASAQRARQETDRATAMLTLAEQRADELAQQNATQQQLLDTIATLETPSITLTDGVLLAPLIGSLDGPRAQRLLSNLVQTAHAERARHVILDITGVPRIEEAVLGTLMQLVQALRLIGCSVVVSGIRTTVAEGLVQQQQALAGVQIAANLQQALQQTMAGPGGAPGAGVKAASSDRPALARAQV